MRDAQDTDVLSERPARRSVRSLRWSVPVALLVIVADQLTKRWALDNLIAGSCSQPDACIDLIGGARLHLVFNDGAAFSRGGGLGPVIGLVSIIVAITLLVMSTRRTDRVGIVLFGVVAGGAVGNVIDRVYRADDGLLSGTVVDFVDLRWWPVFNVADSAIVVGVIAIIVEAFLVGAGDPDRDEPNGGEAGDGDGDAAEVESGSGDGEVGADCPRAGALGDRAE